MSDGNRIGILGAGSWGTALAVICNRSGADVTLWSRSLYHVETMRETRMNARNLPDIFIEPSIQLTADLREVVACDILILAGPAQTTRELCITLSDMIDTSIPLVIASKGIERGSLLLMSEVFDVTLPNNPLAVLSGPNFAKEAAAGMPTATVIASRNEQLLEQLQFLICNKYFRPYVSDDIVAVQVGGAVKNVIAIACGIATGAQLGENARAAIMTRGLSEMMRLAEAKGGHASTLQGLAGMGDLALSCGSTQSRNMALGAKIGRANKVEREGPVSAEGLAEGMLTAEAVYDLAVKLGVPMPICITVADIIKGRVTVQEGVDTILSRPIGRE